MSGVVAPLVIAGRSFRSRLLLGTGGFTRMATLADAIRASETELVTVAMRRVEPGTDGSLLDGVKRRRTCITTESVVMRASTGTVRWVKGEHRPEHEPGLY